MGSELLTLGFVARMEPCDVGLGLCRVLLVVFEFDGEAKRVAKANGARLPKADGARPKADGVRLPKADGVGLAKADGLAKAKRPRR